MIIETSASLGGGWTPVTEFRLGRPTQGWVAPVEAREPGRFYRVRVLAP